MIRSITLHGFKSFADRTRLEFGAGICAIIGPNGSGKSNVVEAIRWVTHGARARELRAGKSSELIFHGSGGKAPLGLAEVQLELSAGSQKISLSRRIYRDGTAEQDLAGKQVRVKDVQAALRGTGLGSGGLAVIGQGEVSSVVQAEGATLLGYLQEAAGLSRAVSARQETAARLKEARLHLAQLELLSQERQQTLERLAREAEAAVLERTLQARQLALEYSLERHRQLLLDDELRAGRGKLAALEQQSQLLALESSAKAQQLEQVREQAAAARLQAEAHAAALETLRVARDTFEQAARYRDHLRQEAQQLAQEQQNLPKSPPEQPAPDLAALSALLEQSRAQAQQAEQQQQALDRQLTQARAQAAEQSAREAGQAAKQHTLLAEQQQIQQRWQEASEQQVGLAQCYAQAQQASNQAEAAYALARARQTEAQQEQRQYQDELGRLLASVAPLEREKSRLEQALNSYARYGEGARNALQLEHEGIVGSVADLLDVPAAYETALTAALGRRLEQVVVQSADDAKEIIEHLKRVGGRATFLPLDLIRARPRRDEALLGQAGVLGNLADLCPTDPSLVGEHLLADTLLVDTLSTANRLARLHSQRPRLVTLEGEVLEAGGAMTGGRLRDTGSAVLADQRRFQELLEELEQAQQRIVTLQTRLAEQDSKQAQLTQEVTQRQVASQAARQDMQQKKSELERLEARLQALAFDQKRLQGLLQAEAVPEQPAADQPTVPELPDVSELEAQLLTLRQVAEQARASERLRLEELALGRELAAAWKRYEQAQQRQAELTKRQRSNEAALTEQERHLEVAAAEVSRREAGLGNWDEHELGRSEKQREQLALQYSNLIAQQNKVRQQLEEGKLALARREGSRSPIADGCFLMGSAKAWQSELGSVRQQREQLGPINARAEADHQAAQAEWGEQLREQEDARAACAELEQHLDELAQAEALATAAAFERVGAAFREYSAELLGGQGELEPEHDAAGHLQGLRLAVQPKGKRTRSMTLLSAGERTMAGLAFLFSLNHAAEGATPDGAAEPSAQGGARGLPLAVLDEVDAPLDEANIRRFTAFLTRFAEKGTQFILVTHQKATMEVAHALWGVTTDQTGASRLLSIRQSDDWEGILHK